MRYGQGCGWDVRGLQQGLEAGPNGGVVSFGEVFGAVKAFDSCLVHINLIFTNPKLIIMDS